PTPRLKDFILPDWISWLLVGSAALALLGSGDAAYLGRNLVVIMAVPFFVLGLVVVHTASKRASAAKFLLVVFYVVLFLLAWALPAVAVLGLIEQWVGIRSRLAPPNPPQEDE
ncbi:MAG: YybS family protein, partial [Rhodospirillales bacterium]|nr:YybS family protein [Rhodospirillales bacterium]